MNPVIAITHASFDEGRRGSFRQLMAQLRNEAPGMRITIVEDTERKGCKWAFYTAMQQALDLGASHVIYLPDDGIVCKDFGRIIRACIEARPNDVFDCSVNHALFDPAKGPEGKPSIETTANWYTTPDGGLTLFGGVMPRALLVEQMAWREAVGLRDDYPPDASINLWAMHTGRKVYHTTWTLVQHETGVPSLVGNDGDEYRRGLRDVSEARTGFMEDCGNFLLRTFLANNEDGSPSPKRSEAAQLPNTYNGTYTHLVAELPPKEWKLDAMYTIARHNQPLAEKGVLILIPTYRMPQDIIDKTRPSVNAVVEALGQKNIPAGMLDLRGDALVCRMRQRGCNIFMKSTATHLLWWDADIECLTPECVVAMLESGHDVVSGCVPFKDGTKHVVCNLLLEDQKKLAAGESIAVENGCLPVQDAGSGFMLVSRKAIYKLQMAHPELLHFSASKQDVGEPLWALFDTKVVDRLYRSEDYYFCHLWRELGGTVHIYEPARFRHYGLHGFEGSLREQYGLGAV